jgi:pantothenate kinase
MSKPTNITPEMLLNEMKSTLEQMHTLAQALQRREARIRKREKELGLSNGRDANRQTEQAVRSATKVDMGKTTTVNLPDTITITEQGYKRDGLILKMAAAGYVIDNEKWLSENTTQITFKRAVTGK